MNVPPAWSQLEARQWRWSGQGVWGPWTGRFGGFALSTPPPPSGRSKPLPGWPNTRASRTRCTPYIPQPDRRPAALAGAGLWYHRWVHVVLCMPLCTQAGGGRMCLCRRGHEVGATGGAGRCGSNLLSARTSGAAAAAGWLAVDWLVLLLPLALLLLLGLRVLLGLRFIPARLQLGGTKGLTPRKAWGSSAAAAAIWLLLRRYTGTVGRQQVRGEGVQHCILWCQSRARWPGRGGRQRRRRHSR